MSKRHRQRQTYSRQSRRRAVGGFALVLVLMVMVLTSILLTGIGNGLTTQFAAYRNTANYDQAQYLAGAGVHHAVVLLNDDPGWRGTLNHLELPPGSGQYYGFTAADGDLGEVVVTAHGVAGNVTRRIQTVVSFDG